MTGHVSEIVIAVYKVISHRPTALRLIFYRIAHDERSSGIIVVKHPVAIGTHKKRHTYIHAVDTRVALGIAVILAVIHLKGVPVKLEAVSALSGTVIDTAGCGNKRQSAFIVRGGSHSVVGKEPAVAVKKCHSGTLHVDRHGKSRGKCHHFATAVI